PIQCLAGALKGAEMIKFITQQNMLWDPYVLVIGDKYAKLPPPGTEGQVRIPTSGFPSGMGNPLNAYFWTQQRVGPWYSSEMVVGTFDTTGLFAGFEGFAGLPQEIQDLLEDIVVPSIQGADLFRKTSSGWELLDFNGLTTDHNTGHRTSGFMHGKLLLGTTNSDVGFQVLRQENGLEGIPIHWPLGPGVPLPLEDLAEWLQMLLNGQLQN
ncbi:MAG: hypothetical protein HKP27_10570, partial [Myxococcales bacterium]|nr:hypothetical protein [Myxococcales bacterium]